MSATRLLKYLRLAHFAKPVAERSVFRTIQKLRAGHLVLVGLGDGELARKMIHQARKSTRREQVRFTGIDLFEMRSDSAHDLSLKQAHQLLQGLGARTKLVPGDPYAALARTANSLLDTDLIVIQADQLGAAMDRAWFYLPRMMHDQTLVMIEQVGSDGQPESYEMLDRSAVQKLAEGKTSLRRAA